MQTRSTYPVGECTYWADTRYHQLHSVWVPAFWGDAHSWLSSAQKARWPTSDMPAVGMIMCMQAGVQGAGKFGHVAIVENVLSSGKIVCSSMNWGHFNQISRNTFQAPAPGISFIGSGLGNLPASQPAAPINQLAAIGSSIASATAVLFILPIGIFFALAIAAIGTGVLLWRSK